MLKIVFRNLEKSELAKEMVQERLVGIVERFPDLSRGQLNVTLGMENSPRQAGPDLFTVKLRVSSGAYGGLLLEKSATNLYSALAELSEHLLERLNRFGDRKRVKARKRARKQLSTLN